MVVTVMVTVISLGITTTKTTATTQTFNNHSLYFIFDVIVNK